MKLTKSKLKEIIKEELLEEAKPDAYIKAHNEIQQMQELLERILKSK